MTAMDMDQFEPMEVPVEGPVIDVGEVPDIPMEVKRTVADEIKDPAGAPVDVAFKFCFLGLGQAGGRLAKQFYQYGYRRVCAINTTSTDLDLLDLPADNKLVVGNTKGGAGGDPEVGKKAFLGDRERVHDVMLSSFGEVFDRIFICASIGGGTGSGGCMEAAQVAREMIERLELQDPDGKDPRVGMILVLPRESDGPYAHATAANILQQVVEKTSADGRTISPLILIDNQRFDRLFPDTPVSQFFGRANHAVCSIFHLLNIVSAQPSAITPFDPTDYETVLSSGMLTFGAAPTGKWSDPDDISDAIRKLLSHQALVSGVDIGTASVAGCVIVAGQSVLGSLPNSHLERGYSMLARMINKAGGAAIRRGVYSGSKEHVALYVVLGGLDKPTQRIEELKRKGAVE